MKELLTPSFPALGLVVPQMQQLHHLVLPLLWVLTLGRKFPKSP